MSTEGESGVESDEALVDTWALEAEPDSAELAAFAPLAERLDPPPPPRLEPGTILADSFEIEEAIGTGGMGIVYRARDLELGRPVALKLHRPMAQGTDRLRREAAAMAKLTHPNVATVHEVGTHEGMLFIAMELIDGVTARRWVTSTERTPAEIVALYHAAGLGLAAAHHAGLVHRDFKPDNVLVGPDDVPQVVDFGLARPVIDVPLRIRPGPQSHSTSSGSLTQTGAVVGTPAYMAPEQCDGGELDARADQFSFCVSLYEALYGERPFRAPEHIAYGHLGTERSPCSDGLPHHVVGDLEAVDVVVGCVAIAVVAARSHRPATQCRRALERDPVPRSVGVVPLDRHGRDQLPAVPVPRDELAEAVDAEFVSRVVDGERPGIRLGLDDLEALE